MYYNALAGYQRGHMTQDEVLGLISSATKILFSSVKASLHFTLPTYTHMYMYMYIYMYMYMY